MLGSLWKIEESFGAIALGVLLAIATIIVLFRDVRALAEITTDHVMTLAMLAVTITAGHYWLPAVQQYWRTLILVLLSGGSNKASS